MHDTHSSDAPAAVFSHAAVLAAGSDIAELTVLANGPAPGAASGQPSQVLVMKHALIGTWCRRRGGHAKPDMGLT